MLIRDLLISASRAIGLTLDATVSQSYKSSVTAAAMEDARER